MNAGVVIVFLVVIVMNIVRYFHMKRMLAENGEIAYTVVKEITIDAPSIYTYDVHYKSGKVITVSATRRTAYGRRLMDLAVNKDKALARPGRRV